MFREIAGQVSAESAIGETTSERRLRALVGYLNVQWQWFHKRCAELATIGVDDIAHPRSRLLSTQGLNTAIRYVAYINDI